MWPLMTQSSPSRTARVVQQRRVRAGACRARSSRSRTSGRRPAAGAGSAPSARACRPARGSRSCPSPARRCRTSSGAIGLEPRISCIRPSLTWPKPWPPSSGSRCAAHSPCSLTCSCSGAAARRRPSQPSSCQSVSSGQTCSRTNCAHPLELALELRLGGEVPGHLPQSLPRCGRRTRGRLAVRLIIGTGEPVQQHLDRLTSIDASFLHQEGRVLAHAHRRRAHLRGAARRRSRTTSTTSAGGCTSSRATARSWPRRRWRPGGRCGSTTRTSTSSTTSATPRCRRRAPRSSCSCSPRGSPPSSWTAPSRCGRTGWSRAWTTTASRSSPRPTTRSSTAISGVDLAIGAVRPRARRRQPSDARPSLSRGARSPSPPPAELVLAGARGRSPPRPTCSRGR